MAPNIRPTIPATDDDQDPDFTPEEQAELDRLEYDACMYESAASAVDEELAAHYESQAASAWKRIAEIYQAHGVSYGADPTAEFDRAESDR